MIQRIQSVWLFLASMIAGALFIFPLFTYSKATVLPLPHTIQEFSGVRDYLPLLLMGAAITIVPLIAIFLFGNRQRQRGVVWLSILFCIGFIALMAARYASLGATDQVHWTVPGPVLPVLSIVCLFLALRGIRKDDKLIKSLDRLR